MDRPPRDLTDADYRALYERAPCGYLSTTPDGTILAVNQTFLDWTGFERDALVGRRSFAELLTMGGRIYHETHYAPTLQMQGSAREIALDIVCADGRRLPALVNATLERGGDGAARRVQVAIFDATERRMYERELLAAKQVAEESESRARLLARTLQQTLIPHEVPAIPGLDVAAVYRPAGSGEEVGGDFYDVFQVGVGDWMVAIGDVQGKGATAAVVTALARYTIRTAAVEHDRPADVLRILNDVLLRSDTERFCTAVVMRCRRTAGAWVVTISCAGHPLPVLATPDGQTAEVGRPGTLLGMFDDVTLHDVVVRLAPSAAIVAFTDGVHEARHGTRVFGEQRIHRRLGAAGDTAGAIATALLDDVLEFQHDAPRDDIAIIAIRCVDAMTR